MSKTVDSCARNDGETRETLFTVKSPPIPNRTECTTKILRFLDVVIGFFVYVLLPMRNERFMPMESLKIGIPFNVVLAALYFGLSTLSTYRNHQKQYECTLEILPLGVQISEYVTLIFDGVTMRSNHCKVRFIPHEDIHDVIVSEVISGSRVRSHIVLRIKQGPGSILAKKMRKINVQDLLIEDHMMLLPAFPSDKIIICHDECMQIWSRLTMALKTRKYECSRYNF